MSRLISSRLRFRLPLYSEMPKYRKRFVLGTKAAPIMLVPLVSPLGLGRLVDEVALSKSVSARVRFFLPLPSGASILRTSIAAIAKATPKEPRDLTLSLDLRRFLDTITSSKLVSSRASFLFFLSGGMPLFKEDIVSMARPVPEELVL